MTNMQALFQMVEQLNPDEWQQLKAFLEEHPPQETLYEEDTSPRVPGLFAGQRGWISPDFNDELPDEFWGFEV